MTEPTFRFTSAEIPGELIVHFVEDTPSEIQERLCQSVGGEILKTSKFIGTLIKVPEGTEEQATRVLQARPEVFEVIPHTKRSIRRPDTHPGRRR